MNRVLVALAVSIFCVAGCTAETSDNTPINPPSVDQNEQQDNPIVRALDGRLQRPIEPTTPYDRQTVDPQIHAAKINQVTSTLPGSDPGLSR